jgi:hypothetical protein
MSKGIQYVPQPKAIIKKVRGIKKRVDNMPLVGDTYYVTTHQQGLARKRGREHERIDGHSRHFD